MMAGNPVVGCATFQAYDSACTAKISHKWGDAMRASAPPSAR
jgi:hypothetical protein